MKILNSFVGGNKQLLKKMEQKIEKNKINKKSVKLEENDYRG